MLVFNNISKKYDKFTAVYPVDITIETGTLIGLLGPNGAGKTTLIRCAGGILEPTTGTVLLDGVNIHTHDTVRTKIGYVPDRPNVYNKLTAGEYLQYVAGLYRQHGPEVNKRIDEFLERFDLIEWKHTLLGSYSHGMRQKVLLMSGFIHQPTLYIVDEPMVGLDAHAAKIFKTMLQEYVATGGTVVLTTHTMIVAEELCERLLIISKGRLVADGSLSAIRQQQQASPNESLEDVFLKLTQYGESDERTQGLHHTYKASTL